MPDDLAIVAQYAKSNRDTPSEVYNAACRLLDQQSGAIEHIRGMAEQAKGGGFGKLCCCFDCEEAQENGRDAPHEPTWTAWTLDPAAVLAVINGAESHGGGRTPQTLGTAGHDGARGAQEAAQ